MSVLLKRYRAKLSWVVVVVSILFLTLSKPDNLPPSGFLSQIPYIDKIAHFLMFMTLSVVGAIVVRKSRFDSIWLRLANLLGVCALGGLIEIIQPYFERSCSFTDFVADVLGAVVGVLVSRFIYTNIIKVVLRTKH